MKHRPPFSHRQRPSWWPENEEWPPKRWRSMRGRPIFRRMGCLFLIFGFLAFLGLVTVLGLFISPFVDIQGLPISLNFGTILPIGFAGFLIFIAATFFGVRNLRRMSMPLDDLLDASNKVAKGDYSVRVEAKGPPEIRSMMQGFNLMVERLQENDRQRRTMLADVSHELRTPLTVIQGNVEGILDGMYPADEARMKSILEETQVLARLTEDLRTLALAESGALHLKRELTDLAGLIRDTVAGFELLIKEKEISIDLDLGQVDEMDIDPHRVREVLSNLIGNALHYAPRQGVVRVGLLGSAPSPGKGPMLFVEDNGPGIESADLPHIFDRFYKSSDSGGMGLGLSIAKYLVEAHGGEIWAESSTGLGTRISFTLPG